MSQLIKPLNDDTNSAQSAIKKQTQNQIYSKQANPLQRMSNIENINSNIQMDEQRREIIILNIMLMISFLFQISSFVLVVLNLQLKLLSLESDTKGIGLEITYSLLSLLSFITYIYLSSQIDDQQLQTLSKLLKISLLFSLLTFVLGICVFGVLLTQDLSCYITQTGKICDKINLLNGINQSDEGCLVKLSPQMCSTKNITSAVKYSILLLSGIPLILMVIVSFKLYRQYQKVNQQNQKYLENKHFQQFVSNSKAEAKLQQFKSRGQINPFNMDSTSKKSFLYAQQNISANLSANNISNDQL
ncbi:hypothetical protein ABPG74_004062 [Tetrahymena malaccensis]